MLVRRHFSKAVKARQSGHGAAKRQEGLLNSAIATTSLDFQFPVRLQPRCCLGLLDRRWCRLEYFPILSSRWSNFTDPGGLRRACHETGRLLAASPRALRLRPPMHIRHLGVVGASRTVATRIALPGCSPKAARYGRFHWQMDEFSPTRSVPRRTDR